MLRDFIENLIVEGGRVFWTAVEAGAGILAAWNVPDTLLDFAGDYEPWLIGAVGVGVAAVATWLKELARKRLV